MRKGKLILVTGMVGVLGLSACQKNPDSSIVVNKDFNNMIEEAQNPEGNSVDLSELGKNYNTYQTVLQDDSLGVTVYVDAKVDIPEAEQMSVIRVAQTPITQELLQKVRAVLAPGETFYDASALNTETKGEIEQQIQALRLAYKNAEQELTGEDLIMEQKEIQSSIDRWQEAYESAPETIRWEDYPSDGSLHSTAELLQSQPNNDYYGWLNSLNPNGEIYSVSNDGNNGNYISIFAQNNEDYGNVLRFRRSRHGFEWVSTVAVLSSPLEAADNDSYTHDIWKAGEGVPSWIGNNFLGNFIESQDEPVTLTQEQAMEMADEFLDQVGIQGFEYYYGGKYCDVQDIRNEAEFDGVTYRTVYILQYMRKIDGAFVTYEGASKFSESWNGGQYNKRLWPIECIEFRINDSGIVGFDYNAPLEVTETVVERSNMKSFDEIQSTFEKMILVTNAQQGEEDQVTIEIDRVVLGYARISEADAFDTGLLVPVWDFKGKVTQAYGDYTYGSVMTINAIDGSVIDRGVGY